MRGVVPSKEPVPKGNHPFPALHTVPPLQKCSNIKIVVGSKNAKSRKVRERELKTLLNLLKPLLLKNIEYVF